MNITQKKRILLLLVAMFSSILVFSQQIKYKASQLKHFEIYSKSLEELRKLTVYIPANFNSDSSYNIVFCTDGQFINEQYKIKLDSLFSTKTVSPFVIVGVHSNERQTPNSIIEYRYYEYTENHKSNNPDLDTRFTRHLNFFVNEVDKFVNEEFNLKIKNKCFYGASNGAAFGVNVSKYYPELFSKYLLCSTVSANYKNLKWKTKNYPFFIIRYGSKEIEPFIEHNQDFSKYLNKKHYKHIFESYDGGHDRECWMNLFIKDLEKLQEKE